MPAFASLTLSPALLQALEAPPTLDGLTVPGAFPQEGGGHLH